MNKCFIVFGIILGLSTIYGCKEKVLSKHVETRELVLDDVKFPDILPNMCDLLTKEMVGKIVKLNKSDIFKPSANISEDDCIVSFQGIERSFIFEASVKKSIFSDYDEHYYDLIVKNQQEPKVLQVIDFIGTKALWNKSSKSLDCRIGGYEMKFSCYILGSEKDKSIQYATLLGKEILRELSDRH